MNQFAMDSAVDDSEFAFGYIMKLANRQQATGGFDTHTDARGVRDEGIYLASMGPKGVGNTYRMFLRIYGSM